MSDAESPSMTRADRRVQDALDELHHCRAEFRRSLQLGSITESMHLRFQQAALDVHDELRPYRDDVEDEWQEATPYEGGLAVLPGLAGRTTTEQSVTMQNGVPQTDASTRPVPIQPRVLLEISHDLDDIAAELGFGSEIDTSDTVTEIDDELLAEVEKWRKQNLE